MIAGVGLRGRSRIEGGDLAASLPSIVPRRCPHTATLSPGWMRDAGPDRRDRAVEIEVADRALRCRRGALITTRRSRDRPELRGQSAAFFPARDDSRRPHLDAAVRPAAGRRVEGDRAPELEGRIAEVPVRAERGAARGRRREAHADARSEREAEVRSGRCARRAPGSLGRLLDDRRRPLGDGACRSAIDDGAFTTSAAGGAGGVALASGARSSSSSATTSSIARSSTRQLLSGSSIVRSPSVVPSGSRATIRARHPSRSRSRCTRPPAPRSRAERASVPCGLRSPVACRRSSGSRRRAAPPTRGTRPARTRRPSAREHEDHQHTLHSSPRLAVATLPMEVAVRERAHTGEAGGGSRVFLIGLSP
jgi:hypothetical protein